MSDGDLLSPEDPFLAHVRRRAARDRQAFEWLTDSAAAWARGEFVKRVGDEDTSPEVLDEMVRMGRNRQVAVLTLHLQLSSARRESHWTVHIGVLEDGQMPNDHSYLTLDKGTEKMAGMFDVMDVFPLPSVWQVDPWPKFYEDPPADAPPELQPAQKSAREQELRQVLEQARQMTQVTYDPRTEEYVVGVGGDAVRLDRRTLLWEPGDDFEATKLSIWNACSASEMARRGAVRSAGGRHRYFSNG